MRKISTLSSILLGSALFCGCPPADNNAPAANSTGTPSETGTGKPADTGGSKTAAPAAVDYGSMVKKGEVFTVHMDYGSPMDMTTTIKDVTDTDVVYFTTTMGTNGQDTKLPRKPAAVAAPAAGTPATTKTGSETITVSGVAIPCDKYEMDDTMNKGKKMTVWTATDKVPPIVTVKMVDGNGKTTMALTSIKGN